MGEETEREIKPVLEKIDKVCETNSKKVLNAFQKNKISEMHFGSSSGYGYGDVRKGGYRSNIC